MRLCNRFRLNSILVAGSLITAITTGCIEGGMTLTFFEVDVTVSPPDVGNKVEIYRLEMFDDENNIVEDEFTDQIGQATSETSIRVDKKVTKILVIAEPGLGYKFDHWSGSITGTADTVEMDIDSYLAFTAHFVPINPDAFGPSDWTPEDPGPGPIDAGLSAIITPRLEMIEGPAGCIDSVLFVDYEASDGEHYINFLQLKKDGEEWRTWQGTPTTHFKDKTRMEVPCLGGPYLQLYATNTDGKEVNVDKEVFIPHTVASLTWDTNPVPGEECRMELKLDFWGRDNHGATKQLTSLVLTANGDPWYNQQLSTDYHKNSITKVVTCGQIYAINLTATDVDGNKYTWRETIEIPEPPEPEDEPPPQEPPQDAPPAQETLYVAFGLSGQCTSSQSGCTCTVSYSVDCEDRSAGDKYPVTNVKLEVNDGTGWQVWHNSGAISTPAYHHADQQTGVGCGKTFDVKITATNSIGQIKTSSGSFTTASP